MTSLKTVTFEIKFEQIESWGKRPALHANNYACEKRKKGCWLLRINISGMQPNYATHEASNLTFCSRTFRQRTFQRVSSNCSSPLFVRNNHSISRLINPSVYPSIYRSVIQSISQINQPSNETQWIHQSSITSTTDILKNHHVSKSINQQMHWSSNQPVNPWVNHTVNKSANHINW